MRGSKHNDPFVIKEGPNGKKRLGTETNNSGGIQGGITNGENIVFRVPLDVKALIVSKIRIETSLIYRLHSNRQPQ